MVLNELVAFSLLGTQRAALDPRSFTIATFALCGFANLSSLGFRSANRCARAKQERETGASRSTSHVGGTMANLMSASIAGMLI